MGRCAQARYLYRLGLLASRSRYSRAMRSSMRFLICFGSGLKWRISCVDASRMSFWWSSDLRVFMMRTWQGEGVRARGEG